MESSLDKAISLKGSYNSKSEPMIGVLAEKWGEGTLYLDLEDDAGKWLRSEVRCEDSRDTIGVHSELLNGLNRKIKR